MNQVINDDVTETIPRSEIIPSPIGSTAFLATAGILTTREVIRFIRITRTNKTVRYVAVRCLGSSEQVENHLGRSEHEGGTAQVGRWCRLLLSILVTSTARSSRLSFKTSSFDFHAPPPLPPLSGPD